jgi:hypothetical protein
MASPPPQPAVSQVGRPAWPHRPGRRRPPPPGGETAPATAEAFERKLVLGGLLTTLALFIIFRAHAVVGDGAVYALTIERSRFFERSIHFAYYLVGWLGSRLLAPFGVPTDDALILLNAVLMTAALGMCWVLFRALEVPRGVALAGFFSLLFAGNVLNEGTNVEIHALELLTAVASYVLFLRGRPIWAGVVFGLAMLVTPLAVLGSGFFVWDAWRRRQWRSLFITAAASLVVFGAVLAFCWQEYLFGVRGFLRVGPDRPWSIENVIYNMFAIAKNFHWAMPFALVGVYAIARERQPLFALMVITFDFHLPAFLGTRDNGVLAITCYPIIALAVGAGVLHVYRAFRLTTGRVLIETAAALYAVMAIYLWLDAPGHSYRDGFVEFLRQAPPRSVVVSSWSNLTALQYYAHHNRLPLPTLINAREMTPEDLRQAVRTHEHAFAVEGLYPNRMSQWMPRSWVESHYRGQAVIPKVAHMLPASYEQIAGPEPLVVRLEPLATASN